MNPSTLPPPVLKVTRYDNAVAAVVATALSLAVICLCVGLIWWTSRAPKSVRTVPIELVEMAGGYADGSPDETLRVDSPDPEVDNAAPVDETSEELEIAESIESVMELSEAAVAPSQRQFDTGVRNAGQKGSARGTGRKPLGEGGGRGGLAREQRWFVRFGDEADLDEYSRQLDFFGIELGALLPGGELLYLSKLSQPQPQVRRVKTGKNEARLYMTWQGGQRRFADVQLFARTGTNVPADAPLFHFYPPDTESQLARLELAYRNRPVGQIKRTYFAVTRAGGGYQFEVVRQLYFER